MMTKPLCRPAFLCMVAVLMLLAGCPATPPSPPPPPYPQAPSVSIDQLAEVLPKDASGKPILLEVGGVPLTLGAPRKDAIGAAAKCCDLTASCVEVTKDVDVCVKGVARCTTAEPWNEPACCAPACVAAYEEERRLGASQLEADRAVFGSTHECFPGLQDLYRSHGGTPYLAPRRAP